MRRPCGQIAFLRGGTGAVVFAALGIDVPGSPFTSRRHEDAPPAHAAASMFVSVDAASSRVTDADAMQRYSLHAGAKQAGVRALLPAASAAQESLPPAEADGSLFTCGQFVGSFLVTGCSKGCLRVHSLPAGQLVFVQRLAAAALVRIEVCFQEYHGIPKVWTH